MVYIFYLQVNVGRTYIYIYTRYMPEGMSVVKRCIDRGCPMLYIIYVTVYAYMELTGIAFC